jgi:hypothetical protein
MDIFLSASPQCAADSLGVAARECRESLEREVIGEFAVIRT